MELQRERPPAYDTAPLTLPDAPTNDLSSPPLAPSEIKLPELRSLNLPPSQPSHTYTTSGDYRTQQWQNGSLSSAVFPSVPTTLPRASIEPALGSPLATESTMSMDGNKTPSVVSMDDPETRMAAEALSGLRNLGMSLLFRTALELGLVLDLECAWARGEHCVLWYLKFRCFGFSPPRLLPSVFGYVFVLVTRRLLCSAVYFVNMTGPVSSRLRE
jgi:hypothetical protein